MFVGRLFPSNRTRIDAARLLGLERATTTPVRPFIFGQREAPSSFKCTRSPGLSSIDVISPSPWRLCLSGAGSPQPLLRAVLPSDAHGCQRMPSARSRAQSLPSWRQLDEMPYAHRARLWRAFLSFFTFSPSSTSRRMASGYLGWRCARSVVAFDWGTCVADGG